MEPLSTVFLDMGAKMKEALDRKKIHNYNDLINPKNKDHIKQLNVPLERIIKQYQAFEQQFIQKYNKPYNTLKFSPQAYTNIISCAIATNQGQIVEVFGDKSSGKSCVLLEIANRYLKEHPQKNILILNGSSGITKLRLQRLPFERVSYKDVYNLSGLNSALDEPVQSSIGMILIDGLLKLAKTLEKPKQDLKNILKKLKQMMIKDKIKYVIENFTTTDKIQLNDQHIYNNQSQFSWIISNSSQSRISVQKISNTKYRILLLKSEFGCTQIYQNFQIGDSGYQEITD